MYVCMNICALYVLCVYVHECVYVHVCVCVCVVYVCVCVHSVLLELMGTWEQLDVNTITSQSNTNFTEAQSNHYQC